MSITFALQIARAQEAVPLLLENLLLGYVNGRGLVVANW
jgi:hypothetical protein